MRENQSSGFPTSQNRARSLKFQIKVEVELYYLCSENKGTDQLCSYCTADLRLMFSPKQNRDFLMTQKIGFI